MLKDNMEQSSLTPATIYNELHKLLVLAKLSHYKTRSYAAHGAFGRIYDDLNDLVDGITEKLIGYSAVDPISFTISVVATEPAALAGTIMAFGKKLEEYGDAKGYCDIENDAATLSGIGAQLMYLSRFK
jgi:hypothetical protein